MMRERKIGRTGQTRRNSIGNIRNGFTMVELIVVLVIVAVLAAVTIPALMGYIDSSKEKEYVAHADAALKATQAALTEIYNDGNNRMTKARRAKAQEVSGKAADGTFKVWTVASLEDGVTPVDSDHISSYTVEYAEYIEDGYHVIYENGGWTLYDEDAVNSASGDQQEASDEGKKYRAFIAKMQRENTLYMWPYADDSALDPKAKTPAAHEDWRVDPNFGEATLNFVFSSNRVWLVDPDGGEDDNTSVDEDGKINVNDKEVNILTLSGGLVSGNEAAPRPFDKDETTNLSSVYDNLDITPDPRVDFSSGEWKAVIDGTEKTTGRLEVIEEYLKNNYDTILPDDAEDDVTVMLYPVVEERIVRVPVLFKSYSDKLNVEGGDFNLSYNLVTGEKYIGRDERQQLSNKVDGIEKSITSGISGDEDNEIARFDADKGWLKAREVSEDEDTAEEISGDSSDVTGDAAVIYEYLTVNDDYLPDGKDVYKRFISSKVIEQINGYSDEYASSIIEYYEQASAQADAAESSGDEPDAADTLVFVAPADVYKKVYPVEIAKSYYYKVKQSSWGWGDNIVNNLETRSEIDGMADTFTFCKNEVETQVYNVNSDDKTPVAKVDAERNTEVKTVNNKEVTTNTINVTTLEINSEKVIDNEVPEEGGWGQTLGTLNRNKDNKLKYWAIYDCDYNYSIDDDTDFNAECRKRISEIGLDAAHDEKITENVLAWLYADNNDEYGMVLEANLGYLMSLLYNETKRSDSQRTEYINVQVESEIHKNFNSLVGGTTTEAGKLGYKLHLIEKILWADGTTIPIPDESRIVNEICISTTTLVTKKTNDGTYKLQHPYTISEMDPEYPCYTVACSVKSGVNTESGEDMYIIYVFTQDGGDMKGAGSLQQLFKGCSNMTENTFVQHLETSEVDRMKEMFSGCSSLEALDLRTFDMSEVEDTTEMFKDVKLDYNAGVGYNDPAPATGISITLPGTTGIDEVDSSAGFTTRRVKYFRDMFNGCSELTSLPVIEIDAAYNMNLTFNGCTKLASITLKGASFLGVSSGNNTNSGTDSIKEIFKDCSGLKTIKLEGIDLTGSSYVKYGKENGEDKIILVDKSSGGLDNIRNFFNYDALRSVTETVIIKNCKFPRVTTLDNVFKNYSKLRYIDFEGTTFYQKSEVSGSYVNANQMFMNCTSLHSSAGTETDDNGNTIEYKINLNDLTPSSSKEMFLGCNNTGFASAAIDTLNTQYAQDMSNMFKGCSNIISTGTGIRIDNATTIASIFEGCTSLTNAIFDGGWDGEGTSASPLTNVSNTFKNCKVVADVTVKNLYSESLGSLNAFFKGDNSENAEWSVKSTLESAKVSNVKLPGITSFGSMFENYSRLTTALIDDRCSFGTLTGLTKMFYGCKALTGSAGTFDISGLHLGALTATVSMQSMFEGCESLTTASPTGLITINANNMSYMFKGCKNALSSAEVRIDSATTIQQLFYNCNSLTDVVLEGSEEKAAALTQNDAHANDVFNNTAISSLTFKNLYFDKFTNSNTDNQDSGLQKLMSSARGVTNANGEKTLTSVVFEAVSVPNVRSLHKLFDGASSLTRADISGLSGGNVAGGIEILSYMFNGCTSLTASGVTFGDFEMSKVDNSSYMFQNCESLVLDNISVFIDTTNIRLMNSMFKGCTGLTDAGTIRIDKASRIDSIFSSCEHLKKITFDGNWDGISEENTPLSNTSNIFQYCTEVEDVTIRNLRSSSLGSIKPFFADTKSSLLKATVNKVSLPSIKSFESMFDSFEHLTNVSITDDCSFGTLSTLKKMFYGCKALTGSAGTFDISGLHLDALEATVSMESMFQGCESLSTAQMTGLETKMASNMYYMFKGCISPSFTNAGEIHIDSATNIQNMFNGCISLKKAILSGTVTDNSTTESNIENSGFSGVFTNTALEDLTIQNIHFKKITQSVNTQTPSGGLSNLLKKDTLKFFTLTNLQFDKVTSLDYMLKDFSEMKTVTFTDVSIPSLTRMKGVFQNCTQLETVTMFPFYVPNLENMGICFRWCKNLKSVNFGHYGEEGAVTMEKGIYFDEMFNGCSSLVTIDLTAFNPNSDDSKRKTDSMFMGCIELTTIYASDPDTHDEYGFLATRFPNGNCNNMFDGCTKLVGGAGTHYSANNKGYDRFYVDKDGRPGYLTDDDRLNLRAKLLPGYQVSEKIEGIAGSKANVRNFIRGDMKDLPAEAVDNSANIISVVDDRENYPEDVYIWYDATTQTVYWASDDKNPYMNEERINYNNGCNDMFYQYVNLEKFEVNWDTSKVTSMRRMFKDCSKLVSANNTYTQSVLAPVTITDMFQKCSSLEESTILYNLSADNFSNAAENGDGTGRTNVFQGCSSLKKDKMAVVFATWNLSGITDFNSSDNNNRNANLFFGKDSSPSKDLCNNGTGAEIRSINYYNGKKNYSNSGKFRVYQCDGHKIMIWDAQNWALYYIPDDAEIKVNNVVITTENHRFINGELWY